MEAVEWYNLNSNRNYPFAEEHDQIALDGFVLPPWMIVDLSLLVKSSGAPQLVELDSFSATEASFNFVFRRGPDVVAYCMVPVVQLVQEYNAFPLVGVNGQAAGNIVVGKPQGTIAFPLRHVFQNLYVEPKVVRFVTGPQVQYFMPFLGSQKVSGLVKLIYDPSVIKVEVSGTEVAPILKFSLTNPSAFAPVCTSDQSSGCWQGNPLRSINGVVKGDTNFKISLKGDPSDFPTMPLVLNGAPGGLVSFINAVTSGTVADRATICQNRTRKLPNTDGTFPNFPPYP